MPKISMQEAESAFDDLLRELRKCPPWLLAELIERLAAMRGVSQDEAIRELAEMEVTTEHMLEAIRRVRSRDA